MCHIGGLFALRAHCALLLDYVPPEEPPTHHAHIMHNWKAMSSALVATLKNTQLSFCSIVN